MEREKEHGRALTEARRDVAGLERELAARSSSAPLPEIRYLVKRLELARKRLRRLLEGPATGLLLLLAYVA